MADLADHAFAHALSVLGPGDPAVEAALVAVRRGGRSRSAVLGHARAEVLARAAAARTADLDGAVPDDLTDLAIALAATRPVLDRVTLDLEGRHGLDRSGFGRALGTSTARAATRAAEVAGEWQRALDPVVLARLGPGGCEGLAAVLGEPAAAEAADVTAEGEEPAPPAPPTLRELLARGPGVLDHAAGCSACSDRLRAMVSVRTLLAQRPLEAAPPPVRAAAAPSRLRRPTPAPPLEPERPGRRWLRPGLVVAAALAFALAGGALAAARHDDEPGTVEALTRVPASGNALSARPTLIEGDDARLVRLTNRSSGPVRWSAVADAAWIRVSPTGGELDEGEAATLRLGIRRDAPEGDVRGSVQISGRDGSVTMVRLATTVEHPPDVAATLDGCAVEAVVEDESEIRSVELHWFEPAATPGGRAAERLQALHPAGAGYQGALVTGTAVTWWVTAADARGNRARTADQVSDRRTCP